MSVYRLISQVQKQLRPDDSLREVVDTVTTYLNTRISQLDIDARVVAGGSVAKNTFLRGSHDIDMFVLFNPSYADNKLPDLLEDVLSTYKPQRVHGSRDYFVVNKYGYEFEFVPVLDVSSPDEMRNVTDASPLHVQYFKEHATDELCDEVRVAKQFAKANGVYGAESFIRGLSGHVIDLLVIHYGSFYKLASAAALWSAPVDIDLENHHSHPRMHINTAKHSPLLVVDPIQPDRNAAAALSPQQFDHFISVCKSFMENPSLEYFKITPFSISETRSDLSTSCAWYVLYEVRAKKSDKRDVAGARVRKFYERLLDELTRSDFSLKKHGWVFEDMTGYVWLGASKATLDEYRIQQGPPVNAKKHVKRFRNQHSDVYEEDGRYYARVQREYTHISEYVSAQVASITQQVAVSVTDISSAQEE